MIIFGFILLVLLITILVQLRLNYHEYLKIEKPYTFNGEVKRYIFTYHEKLFFERLKKITDEYDCYIFPKMRIADIINTDQTEFNIIKSKHIDYTIVNKSCSPILFIELDDYTHNFDIVKERDKKKNIIFENSNSKIIRVTRQNLDERLRYIEFKLKSNYDRK